ncbi:unnamed protein product [Rotaria magnacalcarata]|uniref:G-protein coupled receptors family 1 profile domain-containing protein n=1 Tax=Rotaria magnacalcarata TaxID=392030 RepID=A0A816ANY2_9BILA|nr:unnamed protein product [Rotaria magnacalcarata]CAF1600034.1 unnamed protein product [Rotaria magnacalcarata]CAF2032347.1 unnamed protein product [Rotaria magnacalcarata]CAF2114644.1 unnamed protein product [Rotaria magnacalcarata]CAF3787808.1 unnamed protein product [Rotaria magnacalcarata]
MSNSSSHNVFIWGQKELDDLWNSINRSPSDPSSFWISLTSFIFAVLGSLSNLMSVVVLLKLSTHLSTFIYLTSLSLSDMITCITVMLILIIEFLVQTRQSTSVTILLRRIEIISGALAAASRVLSFWISTGVTIDRYILICYPVYGKIFCTLNRAKYVSRTLFIIACIYSIPLLFEYEVIRMPTVYQMIHIDNESAATNDEKLDKNSMLVTKGYTDLAKRRAYRWAYLFFNAIFVYALPTFIIIFCNVQLIGVLKRRKSRTKGVRKKHHSSHPEKSIHQPRRVHHSKYSITIMVIAMVLVLLLCRSPTIVLWILWSFELTIKAFFNSASSSFVRRFHSVANLIAIINAATNFIPYCVFGQLFRAECLTIYCCRKPTSAQLAKKAKIEHERKSRHSKKNGKIKATTNQQRTTDFEIDYLHTISFINSDSVSGINTSCND